ncbi:DUF6294 family protein [Amycolatopsis sp. A133]|uniref:DUF6294 family protein n=1 Tax=Amycolatopsis sp. A133 TaxID=3064472 RepID=UPI002800181D|nr:DUF6294 family protein [Amycolatopsis sp. A133]MDQ7810327.1 DUF6294 family protein [Amycolatopsis sp. A133]
MKTKLRRLGVLLTLVLAVGGVFTAPASAGTQSTEATCTGAGSCWFTWGRITRGDCTMDQAKWTLNRNGSASFEAVIISNDSNDAWLMWPVVTDTSGFVLGPVTHGGDPKFVRGTVKNQWTWWFDAGSFDPWLFDRIHSMSLSSSC